MKTLFFGLLGSLGLGVVQLGFQGGGQAALFDVPGQVVYLSFDFFVFPQFAF
jgi:hypothetical protein